VPRVTARQVAASLKLQLSLGLLKRSKNGRFERADAFIAAGGVERNTALVRFQREMLSQAHNAWERSKPGEISMHTATFVMPEDQLDKARELTRACTNRLLELSNAKSSAPLRVYHANINVFPVTRPVKES